MQSTRQDNVTDLNIQDIPVRIFIDSLLPFVFKPDKFAVAKPTDGNILPQAITANKNATADLSKQKQPMGGFGLLNNLRLVNKKLLHRTAPLMAAELFSKHRNEMVKEIYNVNKVLADEGFSSIDFMWKYKAFSIVGNDINQNTLALDILNQTLISEVRKKILWETDNREMNCLQMVHNYLYKVFRSNYPTDSQAYIMEAIIYHQPIDLSNVSTAYFSEFLLRAIEANNGSAAIQILNELKKKGESLSKAVLDAKDKNDGNRTLLHKVVEKGWMTVAAQLLDCGADMNAVAGDNSTPWLITARNGDKRILGLFIQKGLDLNAIQPNYPVCYSQESTTLDIILGNIKMEAKDYEDLIQQKYFKLSIQNLRSLLYYSIKANNESTAIQILNELKKKGESLSKAVLDAKDKNDGNRTLLHKAVEKGWMTVTAQLLDCGADMNAVAGDNSTPWLIAARNDNKRMLGLFIQKGLDLNAIQPNYPVCYSQESTTLDIILGNIKMEAKDYEDLIQQKYFKLSIQNLRSLLYYSIKANNESTAIQILNELKKKGESLSKAVLDAKDKNDGNRTLLHKAVEKGWMTVTAQLLDCGADMNAVAGDNSTPWLIAARNDNKRMLGLFIQKGLDLNAIQPNHPVCYSQESTTLNLILDNFEIKANNGEEFISYLLEQGCHKLSKKNLHSLLYFSIKADNESTAIQILNELKKKGESLSKAVLDAKDKNDGNRTLLHKAVEKGWMTMTVRLLNCGADMSAVDEDNTKIETNNNDEEFISYLLEQEDYKFSTENLHSFLYQLINNNEINLIRLFMEKITSDQKIAILNMPYDLGKHRTPLHMVAKENNVELFKLFVENGGDFNKDSMCGTPLNLMIKNYSKLGNKNNLADFIRYILKQEHCKLAEDSLIVLFLNLNQIDLTSLDRFVNLNQLDPTLLDLFIEVVKDREEKEDILKDLLVITDPGSKAFAVFKELINRINQKQALIQMIAYAKAAATDRVRQDNFSNIALPGEDSCVEFKRVFYAAIDVAFHERFFSFTTDSGKALVAYINQNSALRKFVNSEILSKSNESDVVECSALQSIYRQNKQSRFSFSSYLARLLPPPLPPQQHVEEKTPLSPQLRGDRRS